MSKAFTSEESEDDAGFEPPALPPGVQNYITLAGATRMRAEVEQFKNERAQASKETVEGQARIRLCDQRLRYLTSRLETHVPVDTAQQPKDEVRFGATVVVSDQGSREQAWRIVGFDEIDLEKGWISWMSPLATALMGHRVGDQIAFQKSLMTIREIRYIPN